MVRVRYVLDTTGRPLMNTFTVVAATHPVFAAAVRNGLPGLRLAPGRRRGVPVSVEIEERVEFVAAAPAVTALVRPYAVHGVDSTGVLWVQARLYPDPEAGADTTLAVRDTLTILGRVVEHLGGPGPAYPAALCLRAASGTLPARLWDQLASLRVRSVPSDQCPRTYASMLQIVGPKAERAPPGWIDPVRLTLRSFRVWTRDLVVVDWAHAQGTASTTVMCEVARGTGGWDAVRCKQYGPLMAH